MRIGTRATNISGGDEPSIRLGHFHSPKMTKLKACSYLNFYFLPVFMCSSVLGSKCRDAGGKGQLRSVLQSLLLGFCRSPALSF